MANLGLLVLLNLIFMLVAQIAALFRKIKLWFKKRRFKKQMKEVEKR